MEDFSKYEVKEDITILDALVALNKLSKGKDVLLLFIVNTDNKLLGTLSDGDIRRFLIAGGSLKDRVSKAMENKFHFLKEDSPISLIHKYKQEGFTLVPYTDAHGRISKIINFKKSSSVLPVDAVLMAGGKGVRLRPLTEKTPKPLLKVGGKAIIDYNIEHLISYGIDNISVTVNYLREQIEKHFSKEINGVHVDCVRESDFFGTIGAAKLVKIFKNGTILIMNSDLFTNIDYENFYLHFIQHNADMSVAVFPYSVSVPYGIFNLNGRKITGIAEKPTYNYYANAGIYLIKKEILDEIPDNAYFDATDLIEKLINEKKKVIRFPITGYWIDIGKPEDYSKAQDIVKHL